MPYYIGKTWVGITDKALLMEPERTGIVLQESNCQISLTEALLVCPPSLEASEDCKPFLYLHRFGFCKVLVTFVFSGVSA